MIDTDAVMCYSFVHIYIKKELKSIFTFTQIVSASSYRLTVESPIKFVGEMGEVERDLVGVILKLITPEFTCW